LPWSWLRSLGLGLDTQSLGLGLGLEKKVLVTSPDYAVRQRSNLGLGQSPRSWGIFEKFRVKSNLTVGKVTFNCKLQTKNWGQDVLVAPPKINNFVRGATAVPAFPVPAHRIANYRIGYVRVT